MHWHLRDLDLGVIPLRQFRAEAVGDGPVELLLERCVEELERRGEVLDIDLQMELHRGGVGVYLDHSELAALFVEEAVEGDHARLVGLHEVDELRDPLAGHVEPAGLDRVGPEVDERSRGAEAATRAGVLADALALWRGPALADFTYEPFAQRTIRALEESRIQADEELLEAELELGRAGEIVPRVRDLIEAHPFRERLHGLLMTALYRSGRQAEALAAYAAARDLLVDELGIEPRPALQSLEAAILRQDASLEEPAREVSAPPSGEEPGWLPRERRRVTVAVVDVAPAVDAAADPEQLADVGAGAARVATEVLTSHGARVERSLGDELIAFSASRSATRTTPCERCAPCSTYG